MPSWPAAAITAGNPDADAAVSVPLAKTYDGPYAPSEACVGCHATIGAQWRDSMHASALTSPIMLAQTNLDQRVAFTKETDPDTKRLCVNCHGPVAGIQTKSPTLPVAAGSGDDGISCVTCHSIEAPESLPSGSGRGPLLARVAPGRTYFGPLADPAPSGFHQSKTTATYAEPERLCASCHDVNFDRNGDGVVAKGADLVLQTTFDEYRAYRDAGGARSCIDCHMSPSSARKIADGDPAAAGAPSRTLHDHSFVGVDYRLDTTADPQAQKRADLLAGAATLQIEGNPAAIGTSLTFSVTVRNTTGHNLPTGFAFARQMWLEVRAFSGATQVFSSGVLARTSDDLCDANTINEPLMKLTGCGAPDDLLVNFQTRLVDRVELKQDDEGKALLDGIGQPVLQASDGASETVMQFLTGGPVARKRGGKGESLAPLAPLEARTFQYVATLSQPVAPGDGRVEVRLMFRHLPPYFLRAIGDAQPANEPNVGPMVERLVTTEMVRAGASF